MSGAKNMTPAESILKGPVTTLPDKQFLRYAAYHHII
jgi:hypothetical protein